MAWLHKVSNVQQRKYKNRRWLCIIRTWTKLVVWRSYETVLVVWRSYKTGWAHSWSGLHVRLYLRSHQGWSTRTHTCTRTYSSTVFSVLSCTLYLAKFMSTCTRTYLSTVTKTPVLMSTLRVLQSTFLNFNQIGKTKLIVSQALPHMFQMPLICLFSVLKKVASSILGE